MNHIETMKQALDALDHFDDVDKTEEAIKALRAAIAQGESEPMFWVRLRSDGLYEGPIHNAQIEKVRKESGGWSPLYLAAPQVADYVPLSDEQIYNIWPYPEGTNSVQTFARAIERAVRGVK